MSDKPQRLGDDPFVATHAHEVSDLSLLPRRFDMFAHEVRSALELLGDKLLPAITRIDDALRDISVRLNRLENDRDDIKERVTKLEQAAKRRLRPRK